MILDAVLLLAILAGLHYYRTKDNNFLFFCKGAVLFLPPDDKNQQEKSKKKKQKIEPQVSVIKIQYANVKQYPFSDQFNRLMMTIAGLVLYLLIRLIILPFLPNDSMLIFYIMVLISCYMIKIGMDTFFKTNYNKRNCFLISLGLNLFFYLLLATLGNIQGVYDHKIGRIAADYTKHLETIINKPVNFITSNTIIGTALFFNFFMIIILLPSIIKFGNWYGKTLKEVYYEQQDEKGPKMRKVDGNDRDIVEQQKALKQQSKDIIKKLNIYLFIILVLIFLSHNYMSNFLEKIIIDGLRVICLIGSSAVICITMSNAIQFNGSFAYKYAIDYFSEEDDKKKLELKQRIVGYIYYIWYNYFQHIIRIFVPISIFLMVIYWKYLIEPRPIITAHISQRQFNYNVECSLELDQFKILQNLYKCGWKEEVNKQIFDHMNLNGIVRSIGQDLKPSQIQQNMTNFGFLTPSIMVQFFEQLFWYSSVSLYVMTVVYILFLRKTVYDL